MAEDQTIMAETYKSLAETYKNNQTIMAETYKNMLSSLKEDKYDTRRSKNDTSIKELETRRKPRNRT